MALALAGKAPGQTDINSEFSSGYIMQTLNNYNQLRQYEFGDLSAMYCNLDQTATQSWKHLIGHHYPQDVQDEVKRTIVYALTQQDQNGEPNPTPIKFNWNGPRDTVTVKYYRTGTRNGPLYEISLGFDSPMKMALLQRRERAEQKKSKRKK